MTTAAFSSLSTSNVYSILASLQDNTYINQLKSMVTFYGYGNFDLLQKSISLLSCLCDFQNVCPKQTSLTTLKQLSKGIMDEVIAPLIHDLRASKPSLPTPEELNKAQILSKFWVTYLMILSHAANKKNEWGTNMTTWFDGADREKLNESLEVLKEFHHWRIVLMKGCLLFSQPGFILENFFEGSSRSEVSEEVQKHYSSMCRRSLESIQQSSEKTKIQAFLIKELKNLQNVLLKPENQKELLSDLLRGKVRKQIHKLSHSVIFGWDGGIYALLNTISPEEENILTAGEDGNTFQIAESWKKKEDPGKLLIGEGSFGKIRLALALSLNETAPTMKPGEVICLKKTVIIKKVKAGEKPQEISLDMIMESTWNDYSSGEMGHFTFSPSVYDMSIVPFPEMKFHKGYTMQEFVPVLDASKIFRKGGDFFQNFRHLKSYLLTVFESVQKLLEAGICMTDLKPGNTLYDAEYERGMLIDLAGVVKAGNSENLKEFKVDKIRELTPQYADPDIVEKVNAQQEGITVNLHDFSAYAFGKFIEKLALNIDPEACKPYHEELRKLSLGLMFNEKTNESQKRLSVPQGLEILHQIHDTNQSKIMEHFQGETNLESFMQTLYKETSRNLKEFGLNADLTRILGQFIDLFVSQINPETSNNKTLEVENLQDLLKNFLSTLKDRVLVLMGSSGSGKSTILQKVYLESLRDWKQEQPVPLYINLSVETNLKSRWSTVCRLIKQKLNFSLFAGRTQYPMNLFLDSFDEIPVKMNFVSKFLKELGNNPKNRVLICCRSEFVQKNQDFIKWFSSDSGLSKRYIVPLQFSNFNIDEYARKYYGDSSKLKELLLKLQDQSLRELLRTGYMVHLTLEVLPELLLENQRINRRIIYEKHMKGKIEAVWNKSNVNQGSFMGFFGIKNEAKIMEFIQESAELLAKILHKYGSSKINNKSMFLKEFLNRHHYDSSTPCMENKGLEFIIRLLNLNVELTGSAPNEKITIGFEHDTMKNYFIVCVILNECLQNRENLEVLGEKLIFDDIVLVKFIVEVVKEQYNFMESLKTVVLNSRKHYPRDREKDQRVVTAASNALSFLVAANISFSMFDLSRTRICNANLNDGMFSHANFSEADLTGVNLENCKLGGSLFYRTKMEKVRVGIYPETKISFPEQINCMQFSADLEELVAGSADGSVIIADARQTGNIKVRIYGGSQNFASFSPDGKYILSNGSGNTIRLWDAQNIIPVKTFSGHTATVLCGCFSPDGRFILSGSEDKTVKLWEIETGCLWRSAKLHWNDVSSVCFSSSGKFILSGSNDNDLKLWERETGIIKNFEGHSNDVRSVCFSPDDNLIASGSKDKTIKLWNPKTGTVLKTLEGHSDWVFSVSFSPNGMFILSGSRDNSIKQWETQTGLLLRSFEGHSNSVTSVCFSKDGNYVLSGSWDKTIKLWEASTGNLLKNLEEHIDCVKSVSFSKNGSMILSCSNGTGIKILKTEDGSPICSFGVMGHTRTVNSVCYSPDGKIILSSSYDGSIKLWDRRTGVFIRSLEGHSESVNSASFSPDGTMILSCSSDDTAQLWEVGSGKIIKTFEHNLNVNDACFSPDGKRILSCFSDSINLWESGTGELLRTFKGHKKDVKCLSFSPDGELFLSGSKDYSIKLWDVSTEAAALRTFQGHSAELNKVCFSSDKTLILSGSNDSTVRLWETATGELLKTFEGHSGGILSIRFSSDLNRILSASSDKTVKQWDRSTIALIKTFEGHNHSVNTVCFSWDGSMFASGAHDNVIKLWESNSGALISTLAGHTGGIESLAFSPDGSRIVSGSTDHTAKLWDTANGNLIKTFKGHSHFVNSVCFSSDGKHFLTASWDGNINLWNIEKYVLVKQFRNRANVYCVNLSKDGKFFLSGSENKLINLWEIDSGTSKPFEGHSKSVHSVCFSPDETMILSGSYDKTVKLWAKENQELLKTFEEVNEVMTVCFSPNGLHLISGSTDKTIKLWDRESGKLLRSIEGHSRCVNSVCFSPDGNSILSGSNDDSIKRWSLPSLKSQKNNAKTLSTNFSTDGCLILCKVSQDSHRLWDRSSGGLLLDFKENSDYTFPLPLQLLLKQNISQNFEFIQSKTWSSNEMRIFCEKMLVISPVSLSDENVQVFKEKNAIVNISLLGKQRRIMFSKTNTKIKKTCNCQTM